MKIAAPILLAAILLVTGNAMLQTWTEKGTVSLWLFIWLVIVLSFVSVLVGFFLEKRNIIGKKALLNTLALYFSVVIAIAVCEVLLRTFSKELQSYGERNGSHEYNTPYKIYLHECDSCGGGRYFINEPNGHEDFNKPEFQYEHKYNSLGLRDKEFTVKKDSNEYRILGLGDSFTEGVGTSQDSTWLKQLEYQLNGDTALHQHFTTMNGGAHGSDLFFSYDLLTHCLLKYKPDAVILNLNSTDVNDIVFRGGYERFGAKGNYVGKKGPWWEVLFGSSYLVRLVMLKALHYNWQLLSAKQQQYQNEEAYKAISQKLNDYETLAREKGFAFLLVKQPLKEETDVPRGDNPFAHMKENPSTSVVYLMDYLTASESTPFSHDYAFTYYWPIDGHFKTSGYGLEATAIHKKFFKPYVDPGFIDTWITQ